MGLSLNHVIIGGNLTRDPESRALGEGKMVVNFTIANNRRYKKQDGTLADEATFIECEAWARTAEMVGQYLTKGSSCIVLGRLKQENWVDKESGAKRSRLKLVAENVQFLGSRRTEGAESGDDASTTEAEETMPTAPAAAGSVRPAQRPRAPGQQPATQRSGVALKDEPPF